MFSNWLDCRTCPLSGVHTCPVTGAWKKWARWCQLWESWLTLWTALEKQLTPRTRPWGQSPLSPYVYYFMSVSHRCCRILF